MRHSRRSPKWPDAVRIWHVTSAFAVGSLLLLIALSAQAQTYTVIHNFGSGSDGSYPTSTLILDRAGNLYGTTEDGGVHGQGVVFQLKPTRTGGWIFNLIHEFDGAGGGNDGAGPTDYGGLTMAPDGSLYGTAVGGGLLDCDNGQGTCGVVFRLQPSPTACTAALCPWLLSIVYEFGPDFGAAAFPTSNVVLDAAGNLYGNTQFSVAYELSPSDGGWTQSNFLVNAPMTSGLVLDNHGNLYGVASGGTNNAGVVFELSPSSSGWTETVLYNFTDGNDGGYPAGGLLFDQQGNLYGSTSYGGSAGGGTIFELSPSGGGWILTTLCSFGDGSPGYAGPQSALTMDASGNLYGTTNGDGAFGDGEVFKATRSGSTWTCTDLHDFQDFTGLFPIGGVAVDASGNVYGTASSSGSHNDGVVWEITPD